MTKLLTIFWNWFIMNKSVRIWKKISPSLALGNHCKASFLSFCRSIFPLVAWITISFSLSAFNVEQPTADKISRNVFDDQANYSFFITSTICHFVLPFMLLKVFQQHFFRSSSIGTCQMVLKKPGSVWTIISKSLLKYLLTGQKQTDFCFSFFIVPLMKVTVVPLFGMQSLPLLAFWGLLQRRDRVWNPFPPKQ